MSYGTPPPTDGPYGPQPPYGGQPAPTHGSATTALVLGIVSIVLGCGPLGIPAYIVGRRAEREIRASQGSLSGEGLAKAGWILGLIAMIFMALGILLLIIFVAIASTSSDSTFNSFGY